MSFCSRSGAIWSDRVITIASASARASRGSSRSRPAGRGLPWPNGFVASIRTISRSRISRRCWNPSSITSTSAPSATARPADTARGSAVLNADETGWRVNGQTRWLWCFAPRDACCYQIDRSRGGPALAKFFTEAFDGVLVHDFWAAYDAIEAQDHQCCLAHLLRELQKVDLTNGSAAWKTFAKKLRRLIRDGIRLRKRADFDPARYGQLIRRIDRRLMELAEGTYGDADADRLAKRLLKHCDSLFTFLDYPDVPYENNHA
ncbi:MAG: transposase, partial [Planctomycetes bacterium]|nr:transposase [Planctomycetota bacterium]